MDDLELIRNFRSSVERPTEVRAARARRLLAGEIYAPAPRPRPQIRLRAGLVAALIPAGAVAAALAITNMFSSSGSSVADAAIIHRADAALTPPPNMILHVKVAGDGFVAESWQLTSPPYAELEYKGPIGATRPEEAQYGDSASYWDPSSNTIRVVSRGTRQVFDNPLAEVKQALNAGEARVLGSTNTHGTPTYVIRFKGSDGFNDGLTLYVDRLSYRPVLIDDPQRNGSVVHLRVVALGYLPASDANRQLLTLQHWHADARVVTVAPSAKLSPTK